MAIPTLRSLILFELSFDSLLEFEKDSNFSPYLGWEFWASKLERERQIPKEYFYLVRKQWAEKANLIERQISPSERYLELASEFEFFPQSELLRENLVNLEQSLDRADETEISYWVSQLSGENLEAAKKRFSSSFELWLTPQNFVGFRILHKLLFGKERNFAVNADGMILTWQDKDQTMEDFFSEELSGFLLYQQASEFIFKKETIQNFNLPHLNCYLKSHPINDNPYSSYCRNNAIRLLINSGNSKALQKAIEVYSEPNDQIGSYPALSELFCYCLESGKVEMVDTILPVYASWRAERKKEQVWSGKISDLVSSIEFDPSNNREDFSKGGKYDLRKSCKSGWKPEDICEYLIYAVRSGNPQMVDFICSLQGIDLSEDLLNEYNEDNFAYLLQEMFNAVENKPTKIFGFYQILQRILPPEYSGLMEISMRNCSLDMMNLVLTRDWDDECRSYFLSEFTYQSEGEFSKQQFLSKLEKRSEIDSEEVERYAFVVPVE